MRPLAALDPLLNYPRHKVCSFENYRFKIKDD